MTDQSSSKMSAEHKAALAEGRAQGRTVRAYLEALETHRPKRGRKRTSESIQKRLTKIDTELETADPLRRLRLVQEKIDLDDELEKLTADTDLSQLEAEFIEVGKGYAQRKGISHAAFRQLGVPASVLSAAGITR